MSKSSKDPIEHDFEKELSATEPKINGPSEVPTALPTGHVSPELTLYANFCNITGTPEELLLDFSNEPALFSLEGIQPTVDMRVITSYPAAKRIAIVLNETLRRYEEKFGVIEINPRKRLVAQAAS